MNCDVRASQYFGIKIHILQIIEQKWAVARPCFHQSGRFQGVRRPKFRCGRSRQFDFSRCPPETGRYGRFSAPKWDIHFWYLTQKERCTGQADCTQVTLFPYKYWVFEEKVRLGPVSGLPGPKRVLGNCRKWPKAKKFEVPILPREIP